MFSVVTPIFPFCISLLFYVLPYLLQIACQNGDAELTEKENEGVCAVFQRRIYGIKKKPCLHCKQGFFWFRTRLLCDANKASFKTACISAGLSGDFVQPPNGFLLLAVGAPGLQLLEEVVALVIYENECREVLDGDFPDGFHTQFGVFHALDALDAALR